MKASALTPALLRLMSDDDRAALGKVAMLPEEAIAKQVAKSERDLRNQIVSLLRLYDIEVLATRDDKKTRATVGWPDLTFSVMSKTVGIIPCVWELKFDDNDQSEEQKSMAKKLRTLPNFWCVREIRSVDEALAELRRMGIIDYGSEAQGA